MVGLPVISFPRFIIFLWLNSKFEVDIEIYLETTFILLHKMRKNCLMTWIYMNFIYFFYTKFSLYSNPYLQACQCLRLFLLDSLMNHFEDSTTTETKKITQNSNLKQRRIRITIKNLRFSSLIFTQESKYHQIKSL